MTTTAGRPAADEIPEGFRQPGCRICDRIARGDYAHAGEYWRIDGETGLWLHGGKSAAPVAVPAAHPSDIRGEGAVPYVVAAMSRWLAGFAAEVAAARGMTEYDLLISAEGGHPYAEIRRRHRRQEVPGYLGRAIAFIARALR
jgi:hypothetical protein